MTRRKTRTELFYEYRVSVYRPKSTKGYIIRYQDPDAGRCWKRTRFTRKSDADQQAEQLIRTVDSGQAEIGWDEFCDLYSSQHLANKSADHIELWGTTRRWLATYFRPQPKLLTDVCDAKRILRWQNRLRKARRLSDTSVARYSAYLRAALNWAYRLELISRVPSVAVGSTRSRGGAITLADLDALCSVARRVRPQDYIHIQRFMRGLFWSGLRLEQLRRLSWKRGSALWLDGARDVPLIWISFSGEKSKQDVCRYVLPEFWELACESPNRQGNVFPVQGRGGAQMAKSTLGRIISTCGREVGLVTDPETGKCATAHDMRKGCAAALHERYGYTTDEVQIFLGHSDIKVTQRHYPPVKAMQLAARAWKAED
jgi:integrase